MEIRSAAKALIKRQSDGKFLVLTSSHWEENPARSQQPDLPGGIIEPGETILEGLQRELVEEIGVSIDQSVFTLTYAMTYLDETAQQSTTFLLYSAVVSDVEVTLSWEHESYDWRSADEILAMKIREPYPTIFDHFAKVGFLV